MIVIPLPFLFCIASTISERVVSNPDRLVSCVFFTVVFLTPACFCGKILHTQRLSFSVCKDNYFFISVHLKIFKRTFTYNQPKG